MYHQNYVKIFFTSFISSVLLAVWIYYKYYKNIITISDIYNSYDYIIGGGTSGCVLASKLSEDSSKSVLLIEAGGYFNYLASVPLLTTLLQQTKFDWAFKSVPQKFSSFGLHNQSQLMPRGKGLGGSNQINYMVHGTDIKDELKRWKYKGLNWDYNKFDSILHNTSIFNVTQNYLELGDILSKALKELNHQNAIYSPGQNLINSGQRWSSYHSHLKPVLERRNLHVILNTIVTNVIFDNNNNAIAVKILDTNNYKRMIHKKHEIILCAGVFNTPQILLLSGVGPNYILDKFKITAKVNLPGVGKNLHDHLNLPIYVSITKPISLTLNKVLKISEFWNYIIHGKGFLSTTPNAGFVRQNDVGFLLFGIGSTDENIFKNLANLKSETFENMFPFYKNTSQEGFILLTTCLKPKSRGYIALQNSNPRKLVNVNPQYLSKRKDVGCMIRAVKLATDIINTSTFKNIGAKIHWPLFSNCKSFEKINDEYLECIIRTSALTGYHPAGTCRMGTNEDQFAVVDAIFKVKGVNGLRVVDASILPEPLLTYPNSILIAVAEYAASIIKKVDN